MPLIKSVLPNCFMHALHMSNAVMRCLRAAVFLCPHVWMLQNTAPPKPAAEPVLDV